MALDCDAIRKMVVRPHFAAGFLVAPAKTRAHTPGSRPRSTNATAAGRPDFVHVLLEEGVPAFSRSADNPGLDGAARAAPVGRKPRFPNQSVSRSNLQLKRGIASAFLPPEVCHCPAAKLDSIPGTHTVQRRVRTWKRRKCGSGRIREDRGVRYRQRRQVGGGPGGFGIGETKPIWRGAGGRRARRRRAWPAKIPGIATYD